jgi:hypothetical protein
LVQNGGMGLGQLFLEFFELTAVGAAAVFAVLLALGCGMPARTLIAAQRRIK